MERIDMLAHIFPLQGQMYPLIGAGSNETCRVRYSGDYGYFDKNENWEEGWGDEHYVYRAFDISSYRNNEVYALWTRNADGTLMYGNPWTPRYMDVGQVFKRTAHVIHYDAQGNVTKAADVTTWIKLVAYHDTRTFASGRTVEGVAELQYGFTPDVKDVREHYFYGKNLGLVGFEDGVLTTYIGRGTPTTIKPQTVIAWVDRLRPAVPPVQKGTEVTQPAWGNFNWGKRIDGAQVDAVANINLREQPFEGSALKGMIGDGDIVTYWQAPYQSTEGKQYLWYRVLDKDGVERYAAKVGGLTFIDPVAPPPSKVYQFTEATLATMRERLKSIDDHQAGIAADTAALMALLDEGTLADSSGGF